MPEAARDHLRAWVQAFYVTEGISDDLMSTCNPKDFHLLVTTIFDQSLLACSSGHMPPEKLKGGFECSPRLIPFRSRPR